MQMLPNSQNTIDGGENTSMLRITRSFAFGYKIERLQEVLYIFLSGAEIRASQVRHPILPASYSPTRSST
jgi:hypothetical protein